MALTKTDTQIAKGIAILGMVFLHLFCRLTDLPYTPVFWVGEVPLIYYLGLFGDLCVPVFCFCSGYAHYLLYIRNGASYRKRIPGKLMRFLCNYWVVLILFSVLGLVVDRSGRIPGSFETFIGNFLLFGMNYNGAWWFVVTYILLLLLSPLLTRLAQKQNTLLLLFLSGIIYFAAYLFRYEFVLDISNPVLSWLWQQSILLGTSQFGYVVGMICYKEDCIGKLRMFLSGRKKRRFWKIVVVIALPVVAFLAHCFVQTAFVAPFTAFAVLVSLFCADRPRWLDKALAFLGKHSTNIWLCHMFYYFTLFDGLVFLAKYPILIAVFMFAICIATSYLIEAICTTVCNLFAKHFLKTKEC